MISRISPSPEQSVGGGGRLAWTLAALVDAMRVAWIWPWLHVLGAWLAPSYGQPVLPLWSLFALLLGGRAAAQVALQRAATTRQARVWMAVLGPVILLLLIWWEYGRPLALWDIAWLQAVTGSRELWAREVPPAVIAFGVAAGLWLRGVMDAGHLADHASIVSGFVTGSVAFALLLLGSPLANTPLPEGTQAWLVIFVLAGMAALAVASIERSLYAGSAEAPVRLRLNRYWLASVGLVMAVVVLTGLLLGALVAPDAVASALAVLTPVVDLLGQVLLAVIYAVVYIMFLVLSPLIEWLRSLLANLQPPESLMEPQPFQPLSPLMMDQTTAVPVEAVEPLRWVTTLAVLLAVAVILALVLRFVRVGDDEAADETRESILSRALLRSQWQALLDRLRRGGAGEDSPRFVALDGEEASRRRIRGLYQRFLAAMIERERPRPPGATPDGYRAAVAPATPEQAAALERLTAAYVAVRYGASAPDDAAVADADAAWQAIASSPQADDAQRPTP
ncbi:MAG: DUF4129 domain-containing protein [Caldilinea sp.]|nr:DUF4129 domain-containing protein [Caldilineaceae bacterium]MCB9119010.1 DUF4129 domain-containing protein [Caldilineaceae bacterium]MCB9126116.1 DUF4129 domain-containing protein [Caldilineaceae bacterium]MCO5213231.1 DUF4129 domain-containing protein [Caldilinea sp.]MCW5841496.1 DUF4129 domain-containing protein [Caldilinea sp.]